MCMHLTTLIYSILLFLCLSSNRMYIYVWAFSIYVLVQPNTIGPINTIMFWLVLSVGPLVLYMVSSALRNANLTCMASALLRGTATCWTQLEHLKCPPNTFRSAYIYVQIKFLNSSNNDMAFVRTTRDRLAPPLNKLIFRAI